MNEYVVARWRRPVQPLAIHDTPEWATAELGRATQDFRARFTEEDIERFRLGYVCLQCWEPHEHPFPERCSLCPYEMKAKQGEDFANLYQGVERDSRAQTIREGLDRVDDTHERRFHQTKTGIIVPSTI